ncbi:MAG: SPFH domain-containing protein [Planctomycetota bacterium]
MARDMEFWKEDNFRKRVLQVFIFGFIIFIGLIILILITITKVGEKEVGIVSVTLGKNLPEGKIIAVNGEKGIQATTLGPGYHFFYWPWKYSIRKVSVIRIEESKIGLLTAIDGKPLPQDQAFAPKWEEKEFANMLDSKYFLAEGNGYKGPQITVLPPGEYRLNTQHFKIKIVPATVISVGEVGVIKSNVGKEPDTGVTIVPDRTYRGIVKAPLLQGMYYLNTDAFEIFKVSVKKETLHFYPGVGGGQITVRSIDGFEAPIDVSVTYRIKEENAPEVVSRFVDNRGLEEKLLIPSVRAEFRNAAENVSMLNFIKERSEQEQIVLAKLQEKLAVHKMTIHEVYMRDIDFGKDPQLASLLKTQQDRQMAKENRITFIEQQKASEEKKTLNRKEQEAEEERKVVIAEKKITIATQEAEAQVKKADGEARAIERTAQAEAKKIEFIAEAEAGKELKIGTAKAQAFAKLVEQLGIENIAMIELIKEIGLRNIKVIPEVMVSDGGSLLDALVGKYLQKQKQEAGKEK